MSRETFAAAPAMNDHDASFDEFGDRLGDVESETRRLVALALACREEGGEHAVREILDEHPELAELVSRRLEVLRRLGLLDPPRLRFRHEGSARPDRPRSG